MRRLGKERELFLKLVRFRKRFLRVNFARRFVKYAIVLESFSRTYETDEFRARVRAFIPAGARFSSPLFL